jgi:hypothetical protein
MIKGIYFDIDECLIWTGFSDPYQNHVCFSLEGPLKYYSVIRPCAKNLIEFSRTLIGKENVFILTTSTQDYARKISLLAGWGFDNENILSREVIENHTAVGAYGSRFIIPHVSADKNNILIDNLPAQYNRSKISLIGIDKTSDTNYLQVRDYYGTNTDDLSFEEKITSFLMSKYEQTDTNNPVINNEYVPLRE